MTDKKFKLHRSYHRRERELEKNHLFKTIGSGWGKGMVDHAIFTKKMLHPYFWGNWMAVLLLRLIVTILPFPALMFLGKWFGRLVGEIVPSRRYVLKRNLKLAFPMLSEAERKLMSHRIFENSGRALFETGIAWFWSDRRFLKHIYIDPEELKKAQAIAAQDKPILVLTCHFMTLEIMARAYALLIKPGIGVYRASEHPVLEYTQVKGRLRNNLALVDRNDPKSMIKALMRKLPIWYAPDQDYGRKASIFAPFFAVEKAASVIGTRQLARIKDTIVLPSYTVREGSKYRLFVEDPVENFPTDDEYADICRCNQIIEHMIRHAPEQYLWMHRRFKTTPEGEPSRYPELKK